MGDKDSSARACGSPSRPLGTVSIGMRSPTKLRTPTKMVRPRETQWLAKNRSPKKRALEYSNPSLQSSLQPPKRLKLSSLQAQDNRNVHAQEKEAEASQEAQEEQGYTGQEETLDRQVEVAQALEEELLKDNARMRLKALSLKEDVQFYYGVLAQIELLAIQSKQGEETVGKLADAVKQIIASKPGESGGLAGTGQEEGNAVSK